MNFGTYERREGVVVWHGALWRLDSDQPVPTLASTYAPKVAMPEREGRIIRALTQPLCQLALVEATGLTKCQVQKALVSLMQKGRVIRLGDRVGQTAQYQRVQG